MYSMLTKKQIKHFEVAKAVSATAEFRAKIGAAIVIDGQVVSVGTNIRKSHPLQQKYDRFRATTPQNIPHYLHAEIAAIVRAKDYDLSKAEIFIYRMTGEGKLGMSRPCPACMKAIKDFGIKTVAYTTNLGYAIETLTE